MIVIPSGSFREGNAWQRAFHPSPGVWVDWHGVGGPLRSTKSAISFAANFPRVLGEWERKSAMHLHCLLQAVFGPYRQLGLVAVLRASSFQ